MIIRERIQRDGYVLIWTHDVPDYAESRDSTGRFNRIFPTLSFMPVLTSEADALMRREQDYDRRARQFGVER